MKFVAALCGMHSPGFHAAKYIVAICDKACHADVAEHVVML